MTRVGGFAIIPTSLARSASVSSQAKAVYVALTSHAGEDEISTEQLAKEVGTTSDAVARALETLRQRGWGMTLERSAPRILVGSPRGGGSVDQTAELSPFFSWNSEA